jgi:transcriptional regulator with XRE-family HTH domain
MRLLKLLMSWIRRDKKEYVFSDEDINILGNYVSRCRKDKKKTLRAFGRECGVSASTLCRLENGTQGNYRPATLTMIGLRCGVEFTRSLRGGLLIRPFGTCEQQRRCCK